MVNAKVNKYIRNTRSILKKEALCKHKRLLGVLTSYYSYLCIDFCYTVIEITKPPTVVIPPTEKPSEDGRANSVNVTLIYSKEEVLSTLYFQYTVSCCFVCIV